MKRALLYIGLILGFCHANAQSSVDTKIAVNTVQDNKTFVLVIANENYKYEQIVPYALNDGNIFRLYCEKTLGIPADNIKYQPDASLNDMQTQFWLLEKKMKAFEGEARAIVYYSGHGMPADDGKSAYLLPIDGNSAIPKSGLDVAELYHQLGAMPSRQTIVFLDACFSGGRRDGQMLASSRGVAIKAKQEPVEGNLVVFSAAQGNETAYPFKEKEHGLFTYYVLEQLQEHGGCVSLGELSDYVVKQVSRTSIVKNEKSQTPSVIASSTNKDWRNWKFTDSPATRWEEPKDASPTSQTTEVTKTNGDEKLQAQRILNLFKEMEYAKATRWQDLVKKKEEYSIEIVNQLQILDKSTGGKFSSRIDGIILELQHPDSLTMKVALNTDRINKSEEEYVSTTPAKRKIQELSQEVEMIKKQL